MIIVSFLLIVVVAIFFFCKSNKQETFDLENLRPFLCSVSKYRKKDGKIERGECQIFFDENSFVIKQNDEQITNEIDSIYYFDIWEYKDETYFKIKMRSATEYIFKSIRFEYEKISKFLSSKGVKIEDNRE